MRYLSLVCFVICVAFSSCSNKNEKQTEVITEEKQTDLDEDLLRKIEESRSAYKIATMLDSIILAQYQIADLAVAVGSKSVKVSGVVRNEEERNAIQELIAANIDTTTIIINNEITVK